MLNYSPYQAKTQEQIKHDSLKKKKYPSEANLSGLMIPEKKVKRSRRESKTLYDSHKERKTFSKGIKDTV